MSFDKPTTRSEGNETGEIEDHPLIRPLERSILSDRLASRNESAFERIVANKIENTILSFDPKRIQLFLSFMVDFSFGEPYLRSSNLQEEEAR